MSSLLQRIAHRYRTAGLGGIARSLARRAGFSVQDVHPIRQVLEHLATQPAVCIVQIGAYVGKTENDPLYDFLAAPRKPNQSIQAVLVEPVRRYFDQLQRNYAGIPGVSCANVAIADHDGEVDFYSLGVNPEDHGYPAWLAQLGSIKPERIEAMWNACEAIPEYQAFLLKHRVVEKVTVVTFQTLMARHHLTKLDLLQIDAEGYDFEIIKSIDFSAITPRFINYESSLLGENAERCRELLRQAGYRSFREHGGDTLASLGKSF